MTDEDPTIPDVAEERERLLDGWDEASRGWGRQADRMQAAARPVSEWMISHAKPQPGETVLELAAGPGDTGFMAAGLTQPGGTLICSDATAGMLDIARERAAEQGITNVEFKQLQLEWIDLPTASVDVVLCRWGVMLIIDPATALRECRRVLRPGGRIALAVWDRPQENPWAAIIQRTLVALGHVEPPTPGPGMFALADPTKLAGLLEDAGFLDIEIEAVPILRSYASLTDWLGETRDLSRQFAPVWDSLEDQGRRRLRDALAAAAGEYTHTDGALALPGSSLAALAFA
ncbi:MAG TPA: methyltransferase domain-containing protein [Solirubrobacteraceae bacterium]|nr:methyltransferase domain-containing protein [Solirubrobacteraceae bacterium]